MPTLIGQSLGRYHILEQLGEGGMAVVYKALDTRLERNVAIKVILPGKEHSDKFLKRFEREAKALASLSHPNIVKVIDYGDHEGLPFLVMEYIPGGTLKHKLGRPIPWKEAARTLIPIARALAYAHENKIIHRDVKPANILITQSGEPMLSDFGIAKMLETEETLDLTGTGVGVGTPEYMSPEQAQGNALDGRSDIYSLGVVLFEMVTGRKPYQADTPLAVVWKQASEPLPRPKTFVQDIPSQVENTLLRTLAKKAEDRFQSMEELATALENLNTPKGARDSQPGVTRRPILVAAAVLITLLVIFAVTNADFQNLFSEVGLGVSTRAEGSPSPTSSEDGVATPSTTTPAFAETYVTTGNVLFSQDFERVNLDGFTILGGSWEVVPETLENHVLQIQEPGHADWPFIEFGPRDFENGVIQYRLKVTQIEHSNAQAGMAYLFYRVNGGWSENSYAFQIQFDNNLEELNFVPPAGNRWPSLATRTRRFQTDQWYTVRMEIVNWSFKVYVDGDLFIDTADNEQRLNAGRIGFQGSPQTTVLFDDVQIWELDSSQAEAPASTGIYLKALTPVEGWAQENYLGFGVFPWSEGPMTEGRTIFVQGRSYPEAIFAHATSNLKYETSGQYSMFEAQAYYFGPCTPAGDGAIFRVFGDNRLLYTSSQLNYGDAPDPVNVSIAGVKQLLLSTDALEEANCDWTIWLDPQLIP